MQRAMAFCDDAVEVNGCRIRVRRGGEGGALLFLHGTEGLVEWPVLLDTLARRHDVIAPDHPCYGESDTPDWIDDISDVAYLYLDLIERMDLKQIHLVGHSIGGWIALEMAVRSTERLASLTLIAAAGINVDGVPKTDIFIIDPDETARLSYVDGALGEAAARRAAEDKYQDVIMRNRVASARLGWHPRFFNPRLERWLGRVRLPSHVVWGDGDRIIPPAYGGALHALLPGSRLTVVPRAGHLPHVECTAAVLDAVSDFIADVEREHAS